MDHGLKLLSRVFLMISLSLSLGASTAMAQSSAAEFKEQVGLMVYSLENIHNKTVIDDLNQFDTAAGSAIATDLAAEIFVRFETSLELAAAIIRDPSMSQDEKREVAEPLIGSLAQLFETVAVQSGDDRTDPLDDHRNAYLRLFIGTAKENLVTLVDLFSFPRGQRVLSLKEQQELKDKKEKEGNGQEYVGKGRRIWKPKERMVRDLLLQMLTIATQKKMKQLGEIAGERADDYLRMVFANQPQDRDDQWADMGSAQRMEIVRTQRRTAHYLALGTVAGIGAYFTFFPFEFVGLAIQDYSEFSARLASLLGYSALVGASLVKQVTAAFSSVPGLRRLVQIAENPENETLILSEIKQPFLTRITRIKSKLEKEIQRVRKESGEMSCKKAVGK